MVSEDLRYTFYALNRGQFMSEASNTTLDWLKESLSELWEKEIWPGCNPLDYFICGISEYRVNVKPHIITPYPISKIMEVMGSLDRDTMAKAFKRFRSSTEALAAADGHFIEKVDSQYVPLPAYFYFDKIGRFSAVLCNFFKIFVKFQIYRCHPVYNKKKQ